MKINFVPTLFVFILFGIGMYLLPGRVIGTDFDGVPGNYGDARLNNFFLEHGYQYVTGKTPTYWNAPFMYPDQQTLTYSDNLLGTLPLYIFFRLISFDRETSFQLWFILALFLTNLIYPGIRWAIRHITIWWFVVSFLLWIFELGFWVVDGRGLFFFSLGVWLQKTDFNLEKKPKWLSLYIAWLLFIGFSVIKTFMAFEPSMGTMSSAAKLVRISFWVGRYLGTEAGSAFAFGGLPVRLPDVPAAN